MQKYLVLFSQKIIRDDPKDKPKTYKLEFTELISKDSVTTHIIQVEKAISDMTDIVTDMFDKI